MLVFDYKSSFVGVSLDLFNDGMDLLVILLVLLDFMVDFILLLDFNDLHVFDEMIELLLFLTIDKLSLLHTVKSIVSFIHEMSVLLINFELFDDFRFDLFKDFFLYILSDLFPFILILSIFGFALLSFLLILISLISL